MSDKIDQYSVPGLANKIAAITGGSRGIGRSIAITMSRYGAHVAIIDIDEDEGNKTVREISDESGKAYFFKANVTVENDVIRCMESLCARLGGLDILVNNAGVTQKVTLDELTVQEWRKVIDINLTGTFICSKIAAGHIIKRGGGAIIMISSGSAITGTGGGAHYHRGDTGCFQTVSRHGYE